MTNEDRVALLLVLLAVIVSAGNVYSGPPSLGWRVASDGRAVAQKRLGAARAAVSPSVLGSLARPAPPLGDAASVVPHNH